MYDRSSPATDVNTCRRQLFTSSNRAVEHFLSSFDFINNQKKEISFAVFFQLILYLQCRNRSPLNFPFRRIQSSLQPWFAIPLKVLETLSVILIQVKIVLTADQPVYARRKQVQWTYHEHYKDVTWLMGPLHIEMALMKTIGNWIQGSGWRKLFFKII